MLGQTAMVLFLIYFLLVTGDLYKRKVVKIAGPTLQKKKVTVEIKAVCDRIEDLQPVGELLGE